MTHVSLTFVDLAFLKIAGINVGLVVACIYSLSRVPSIGVGDSLWPCWYCCLRSESGGISFIGPRTRHLCAGKPASSVEDIHRKPVRAGRSCFPRPRGFALGRQLALAVEAKLGEVG